ncbi:hypothetical protein PsorP6_013871 [Peronosclerospora sorghi]|uniref:Uncharacterized protein n=1 Tax=Peronosclerospora sorghi TaxID=230839 RepID=A0ACC0VGY1_9STRA|nr:hypothetical protein PsorP6_013871 [Peronosclerospora sorghi]
MPRRSTLTTEQKLAIVRQSEKHPEWKQHQLCEWVAQTFQLEYVPSQPTISSVLRHAGKPVRIRKCKKNMTIAMKPKIVKCPEMEKAMLRWLEMQIEKDAAITMSAVQTKARELEREGKARAEGFVVSKMWVDSFIRHHVLNCPFGLSDSETTGSEEIGEEKMPIQTTKKVGKTVRTEAGKAGKTSRRVVAGSISYITYKYSKTPVQKIMMVGEKEAERQNFYVVFIPADEGKELEEWAVALPADKEAQLGCLTERLRQHFKGGRAAVSKQQQDETFKQQLLAQLPKGATLTDEMVQTMLQMDSLVDSIPLVLNTPDVKHVGINMYVDDRGTAKALPSNVRASAIARACGKMVEVKGDAFIGRVYDNDDDFVRMDFRLSEVSGDAPWVQIAKSQAVAGSGGALSCNTTDKSTRPKSIQRICGAKLCSKNGTLRCSRCKAQFYCSAKCQKADWKVHKLECTT